MKFHLTATGRHLLYGITLPPDKWIYPAITPARQAGTRITCTRRMEDSLPLTVYIARWFTCPETVSYPSTNPAAHGQESNWQSVGYNSDARLRYQATHVIIYSRSSEVINVDINWKCMWDFLLVINSNTGPNLLNCRDTATSIHKIATVLDLPLIKCFCLEHIKFKTTVLCYPPLKILWFQLGSFSTT